MKPSFSTLKKNHYSSTLSSTGYLDGASLYNEMGYDIAKS